MFSWRSFVDRHRIEYTESGAHTKRGNLYVWCPWCNDPDRDKKRLGLHLDSARFGCWKDARHRGSDPVRLIRALLRCSWEQAIEEASEGGARTPIHSLRERLDALDSTNATARRGQVHFPSEFVRFEGEEDPPLSWYRGYLQRRGFPGKHADRLARRYRLRAAVGGRFDRRVILPFHDLDGRLVGWSGRAIGSKNELRYLTEGPTREVLYNGHRVLREGGRLLVITEGPFDALKVDYYGADLGIRAIAVTGLGGTGKVGLVTTLFERGGFREGVVLLDATATGQSLRMRRALGHLPFRTGRLPAGVKDPGDLTARMVRAQGFVQDGPQEKDGPGAMRSAPGRA